MDCGTVGPALPYKETAGETNNNMTQRDETECIYVLCKGIKFDSFT